MNQQKKIYGVPSFISRQVNKIVDESNDRVIELVLTRMLKRASQENYRESIGFNEDWHKNHKITGRYERGCGCLYCQLLHRYISTKISARQLRRRIDNSYDYMFHPFDNPEGLNHLNQLEKEWPRLKEQKNQIAVLAGIIK